MEVDKKGQVVNEVKRKKYGGRKKGTPNKDTKELRERVSDLIDNNFDSIQADLDQLEPKERLDFLIKLLEYGLPKLQRVENEMFFNQSVPVNLDKYEEIRKSLKIK